METLAMTFPVRTGQEEHARQFALELQGPRRSELNASGRALGVKREEWFIQQTPVGPQIVAFLEADNPARLFDELRSAKTGLLQYMKEQMNQITGADFEKLPVLPERIFRWADGAAH